MKKHEPIYHNPYATNRGGRIESPKSPAKKDPRATVTKGDDLRRK